MNRGGRQSTPSARAGQASPAQPRGTPAAALARGGAAMGRAAAATARVAAASAARVVRRTLRSPALRILLASTIVLSGLPVPLIAP